MDEREPDRHPGCGVRPGEPCRLCVPGATGPRDCGLVYLVMTDPVLRAELERLLAESAEPMFAESAEPMFAESEGTVSPEHVGWIQG